MILHERALLDLNAPVMHYFPEFGAIPKNTITIRMLLTHTAGLKEFHNFFAYGITEPEEVRNFILNEELCHPVGKTKYSDFSMIILGWIIEKITGKSLQDFVTEHLYKPLGMNQTGFRPIESQQSIHSVVPSEVDSLYRKRLLWGEVHDPTAFLLGGVSGHAGLFSCLEDVTKFARMILRGGCGPKTGLRIFQKETIALFTTQIEPLAYEDPKTFALGWDVSARRGSNGYTSAGSLMGPKTFGHTGFTGTSLWIDPESDFFVILLTSAVHPTVGNISDRKLAAVRPMVADLCYRAVFEANLGRKLLEALKIKANLREETERRIVQIKRELNELGIWRFLPKRKGGTVAFAFIVAVGFLLRFL